MDDHKLIEFDNRVDAGHIQLRCKCLSCGLHFSIYTWYEDWAEKVGKPACPECGERTTRPLATVKSKKHIYEEVPGIF